MLAVKQPSTAPEVKSDTGWSLVETPGSFDAIEDLHTFLDRLLPAMNLPDRQEADIRREVEEALAFRLANPLPGDPGYTAG